MTTTTPETPVLFPDLVSYPDIRIQFDLTENFPCQCNCHFLRGEDQPKAEVHIEVVGTGLCTCKFDIYFCNSCTERWREGLKWIDEFEPHRCSSCYQLTRLKDYLISFKSLVS